MAQADFDGRLICRHAPLSDILRTAAHPRYTARALSFGVLIIGQAQVSSSSSRNTSSPAGHPVRGTVTSVTSASGLLISLLPAWINLLGQLLVQAAALYPYILAARSSSAAQAARRTFP